MIKNYETLIAAAQKLGRINVAVAAAQDAEVIEAVKMAADLGLVRAVLVGDGEKISALVKEAGIKNEVNIVPEADVDQAALKAAALVRNGEAQVLVKGLVNSSNFLRAALDPQHGLRGPGILAHLACFEIPGEKKLAFHSDGGMNIAPTLDEKRQILICAVKALQRIGIERPNVAVLTANEQVNPKMPATLDAKALVEMWQAGAFPECVVEGPIALDVALSQEAARHKGLTTRIGGEVDFFLMPNIEAGNLVGKTLVCYTHARMAGVILGATHPIVLVSRSDNAEAKVNSIALACLLAER